MFHGYLSYSLQIWSAHYPWVGVYWHVFLLLCPLTLKLWSDLDILVAPGVFRVFELQSLNLVCTLPMIGRCVLAGVWDPMIFDLTMNFLWHFLWPKYNVLKLQSANVGCKLSPGSTCALAYLWDTASCDLDPVTLTLKSLWHFLCPGYWSYSLLHR